MVGVNPNVKNLAWKIINEKFGGMENFKKAVDKVSEKIEPEKRPGVVK